MHIINVTGLAARLKASQVSVVEKFFYTAGVMGLVVSRVPIFGLLPVLYSAVFNMLKVYLEFEAKKASVTLVVYDICFSTLFFGIGGLLIGGLIYLWMLFWRQRTYRLIEDSICLSFPAIMRIMFWTVLFVTLFMIISSVYFVPKLCALSNKSASSSWLMRVMYTIRKLNIFKTIIGGAKRYWAAQHVFEELSQFSIMMYYVAIGLAYVDVIWFIHIMRKNLQYLYAIK